MLASGKNTQAAPGATLPDDIKEEFILMKRRILSALTALALLLTMCPLGALAADADTVQVEAQTESIALPDEYAVEDNDELFDLFVMKELYGLDDSATTFGDAAGSQLKGLDANIYAALKKRIEGVAKNGGSTKFMLPFTELEVTKTSWAQNELTNAILDEKGEISDAAMKEVQDKLAFNGKAVVHALLVDLPYDFYWFDKTVNYTAGALSFGATIIDEKTTNLSVKDGITFTFQVAQAYQASDNKADAPKVTSDVTKVTNAADKAVEIVGKYKDSSDFEKLDGYRKEICDLVEYNHTAADNKNTPYGDPWQLIYVFDGDETTKVVCEGYSKAFQYLCDLTTFADNNVKCYTVTGTMNGGTGAGAHMWNIVTIDSKNYLVDITNCDEGTVGAFDKLFLVGTNQRTGNDNYIFNAGNEQITYIYDTDYADLLGAGVLNLATENYNKKITPVVTTPPDVATITYGDTLVDTQLSNGKVQVSRDANAEVVAGNWTWKEGQAIDSAGDKTLTVVFTPSDQEKYNIIDDYAVSVKVNQKKLTDVTIGTISDEFYTGEEIRPDVTAASATTLTKDTDYTVEYSNNTQAGTATVKVKPVSTSNYTFDELTTTFTIKKYTAEITIAVNTPVTYDGEKVDYKKSGESGADTADITYTYDGDGTVSVEWYDENGTALQDAPPLDVGSYQIGISAAASNKFDAVAKVTESFTIVPATYQFTNADIDFKTYPRNVSVRTNLPASSTTHGKGLNGDKIEGTLTWYDDEQKNNVTDSSKTFETEGTRTLYWVFTPDGNATNYVTTAESGSLDFTVTEKEPQNLYFAKAEIEAVFEGEIPVNNLVNSVTTGGGEITYTSSEPRVATVTNDGTVTIVGVGETIITATAVANDTYAEGKGSYKLVVKPKPISITLAFADPSKTEYIYENAPITPAVKVIVTGSDPEKVLVEGTDYTVVYTDNNAVGTATVKVVPAGNYTWDENTNPLTFEIKAKPSDPVNPDPTLKTQNITFPANEVKKIYGDADFTQAINADSTGRTITYASSDAAIATVTNAGVVHIVKPGTVTITATAAQNATYAEASASYTLTIDKATVTITAANKSAYVGDSAPTLGSGDYTITGLVGDDKLVGDVNIAYASTPDMSRAGTVSIQVSGGTVPDADKYNTAIQYVYGTLTISTRSTSSSSSSGGGGKRRPSSSSSSTPTQTTTKNPQTGAVVETTKNPDGSRTQVTTETDGTVSTRITDANGSVSCEVSIPSGVHEKSLPISSLRATKDSANAPTLTIFAQADVKVKVPVSNLTPGVVAIVVGTNGQQEILKTSVPETDGLSFTAHGDVTIKIVDNSKTFSDVKASDWHKNAVDFASARSLFNGTSNTTFSPESPMTRGMLAMVLHNLEDNPPAASNIYFPDVAAGAWYADAVRWASAKGIISGYDNGQVGAEDDISREQLAVILWRYAGSPAASSSTLNFTDAAMASGYATSALSWATEAGIISGTGNGALSPKAQASRAQVAQMLKNFITVMN